MHLLRLLICPYSGHGMNCIQSGFIIVHLLEIHTSLLAWHIVDIVLGGGGCPLHKMYKLM